MGKILTTRQHQCFSFCFMFEFKLCLTLSLKTLMLRVKIWLCIFKAVYSRHIVLQNCGHLSILYCCKQSSRVGTCESLCQSRICKTIFWCLLNLALQSHVSKIVFIDILYYKFVQGTSSTFHIGIKLNT